MKTLAQIYRKKFQFGGNDWNGLVNPEDEWSGMMSDTATVNSFNTPEIAGLQEDRITNPVNNLSKVNQATGTLFGGIGTLIETNPRNRQGITGTYAAGQNAVLGASKGAQMGSIAGPLGTAIGAGVGGIYGYIKGKNNERKEKKAIHALDVERNKNYNEFSQARLANNPNFAIGDRNAEMYKHGGELKRRYQAKFTDYTGTQMYKHGGPMLANMKSIGGSLIPMSKDTTLASGRTHKEGGIGLPNQGAELEHDETTSGDYIFSKVLGFSQLHKPIARAEGKIQNKPATAERIKSLSLLQDRTEQLKVTQEMVKQHLNLQ